LTQKKCITGREAKVNSSASLSSPEAYLMKKSSCSYNSVGAFLISRQQLLQLYKHGRYQQNQKKRVQVLH